ncbi:MAG: hypothetical protein R3190_10445 [Thermoanaerobaculia bacterium]|nr:hypothetical protein [Thermoanaerobaculia bacterium]
MTYRPATALILCVALVACAPAPEPDAAPAPEAVNPAADGFDAAGSDPEAIEIADRVMAAMGGRAAWDTTRYLSWRFFAPPPDGRTHVWDKETGWVRFEQGDQLTLVNVRTREGRSFAGGEPIEDPEALEEALQQGYEAWINDSYWLLMPYKLKDSGVTLTYVGEGETEAGRPADVLQLTFEGVGVTPQNKYHVWVDKERSLVEQWAYFESSDDPEPRFVTPWADWREYGDILLSGGRGQVALTEIAVHAALPEAVFTSPEPVDVPTSGGR